MTGADHCPHFVRIPSRDIAGGEEGRGDLQLGEEREQLGKPLLHSSKVAEKRRTVRLEIAGERSVESPRHGLFRSPGRTSTRNWRSPLVRHPPRRKAKSRPRSAPAQHSAVTPLWR